MLGRNAPVAPGAIVSADPVLELVIPAFNEGKLIEQTVRRTRSYLDQDFGYSTVLTVAENASTDSTLAIARSLAAELGGVRVVHLDVKGRGLALRTVWSASSAQVVAYMDADLSTDLADLDSLVTPLMKGNADVGVGSRLAPGAQVTRRLKREFISRGYNLIVRLALHSAVSDSQCGFKALRADVARQIMPQVEDDEWFFDTELLYWAQRRSLRIHEIPVHWVDRRESTVHLSSTALADLKGILRLRRTDHV